MPCFSVVSATKQKSLMPMVPVRERREGGGENRQQTLHSPRNRRCPHLQRPAPLLCRIRHRINWYLVYVQSFSLSQARTGLTSGLYYKSFTIVIYERNAIGQYYKITIVVNANYNRS